MSTIKYLLGTAVLSGLLLSCEQQKTPKSVATAFVQHAYALEFDEASGMATADGQQQIRQARAALEARVKVSDEQGRRAAAPAATVFDTETLTESGSGDDIVVQNNQLRINLHKEGSEWKVAPAPDLVDALVNYPANLELAKTAWDAYKQEADNRTKLVQEFAAMRRNHSENSPELQAMAKAADDAAAAPVKTGADRLEFIARQDRLETQLEKGMAPARNASADFSMNYISQLSAAKKTVGDMRTAYIAAARKAHVKDYPPAP